MGGGGGGGIDFSVPGIDMNLGGGMKLPLPGFDVGKDVAASYNRPGVQRPPKSEIEVRRKKRSLLGMDFTNLGTILTSPQGALIPIGMPGQKTLLGE